MSNDIVVVLTAVIPLKSKTRSCSVCGSTKTKMEYKILKKSGIIRKYPNWCRGMCMDCYNKLISNSKHRPIDNPKRIRFKDKRVMLKQLPRVGVCCTCRAVVGQINAQLGILCRRTDMNHFQYHEDDPLKDTLEQCNPCHRRYHRQLREEVAVRAPTRRRGGSVI